MSVFEWLMLVWVVVAFPLGVVVGTRMSRTGAGARQRVRR